jgi:2-desacetyl-2-hydroxyethyl bacteriochlorophyllide A dehydrogenase
MKAIIKDQPGPGGLRWREWHEPTVKAGDVLVEIERAGICSTDVAIYDWTYRGRHPIELPTMLGHEAVGTITAIGSDVSGMSLGQRVALQVIWGRPHSRETMLGFENLDPDWLHIGASALGGAFAERIAMPVERVIPVPARIDGDDAVLIEPLAVAIHALELVALAPGDTVVVIGPGPFGLLMCQVASRSGARVIVAGLAGTDDARLECARDNGACATVATSGAVEEATEAILAAAEAQQADVVMDCGGTPESTQTALEIAAPAGRIAVFGFTDDVTIQPLRQIIRKGLTLRGVSAAQRKHYGRALELIERGLAEPRLIVSHRMPIDEIERGIQLVKARKASKVILEIRSKG